MPKPTSRSPACRPTFRKRAVFRWRENDASGTTAAELERQIERLLDHHQVGRYLKVRRLSWIEHCYVQTRRGRPGANTAYRRVSKRHWDIEWHTDEAAGAYDRKSDGVYPLLTNDRTPDPADVLKAHKELAAIEKRFSRLKSAASSPRCSSRTRDASR